MQSTTLKGGSERTTKLVIPGARPPSWNQFWSTMHWSERKKLKDAARLETRAIINPRDAVVYDVPVAIHFTAYMKGRLVDCSNLCIKPYEDALIGWYIEDDSPKYVRRITLEVLRDKENPRLEIEIIPT